MAATMQLEQCLRLLQHSARQGAVCRPGGGLYPSAAALAALMGRAFSSSSGGGSDSSPAANSSGSSGGSSGGPRPWRPGQRLRVAVGISGGVDSAVAAMLLQRQGHEVVGVFMRNWDESEETGNQNCSVERDARDAAAICRQLGVPLHEADFVSKYWNQASMREDTGSRWGQ